MKSHQIEQKDDIEMQEQLSRNFQGNEAGKLRFAWIASMTGIFTLLSCFKIIFGSLFKRLSISDVDQVMRWWATKLLGLVRVTTKVVGKENLPDTGRRVIVMCNHSSLYDIPVAIAALDISFRFVAKKELFNIPIFGSALKRGGFLSIDRNNREQAVKDLNRAKEQMLKGIILWMSPEGTRSKDGKLAEFKRGGFHVAIETKAIIVPVVIKDIHKLQAGDELKLFLNQDIEVEICETVDSSEYDIENRRELINEVRQRMLTALHQ